jgi:hypothetical protein
MNRMKIHGKPPSEAQLTNSRYVIVASSLLKTDACLILQLYRFRWQIELVFKRHRTCSPQSLFGYNQIPSKDAVSGKAWFYGKLLPAAFCETRANKARFSPEQTVSSTETENERMRWSLWKEQRVMLSIVVYALLPSFRLMFSHHTFQRFPSACADSKRQRVPALFRPLHPIPK